MILFISFQCSVKRVSVASLCVNVLGCVGCIAEHLLFPLQTRCTFGHAKQMSGDLQDIDGISACRVEWRIDSPILGLRL